MEPEQAAIAGELLAARRVVPIHYDGYDASWDEWVTLDRLQPGSTRRGGGGYA